MPSFLHIVPQLSDALPAAEAPQFSAANIDAIRKDAVKGTRVRKCDTGAFIFSGVRVFGTPGTSELISIRYTERDYKKLTDNSSHLSSKCYYTRLCSRLTLAAATAVMQHYLYAWAGPEGRLFAAPDETQQLLQQLQADDLVFAGSKALPLRPEILKAHPELEVRSNSGSTARPPQARLYLNWAFSLKKQNYEYIEAAAAADGKAFKLSSQHRHHTLIVCSSTVPELEKDAEKSLHPDPGSSPAANPAGQPGGGAELRIIRPGSPAPETTALPAALAENASGPEVLSALFSLSRHTALCTCADGEEYRLQGVNSANLNIILVCLIFSLLGFFLKNWQEDPRLKAACRRKWELVLDKLRKD